MILWHTSSSHSCRFWCIIQFTLYRSAYNKTAFGWVNLLVSSESCDVQKITRILNSNQIIAETQLMHLLQSVKLLKFSVCHMKRYIWKIKIYHELILRPVSPMTHWSDSSAITFIRNSSAHRFLEQWKWYRHITRWSIWLNQMQIHQMHPWNHQTDCWQWIRRYQIQFTRYVIWWFGTIQIIDWRPFHVSDVNDWINVRETSKNCIESV